MLAVTEGVTLTDAETLGVSVVELDTLGVEVSDDETDGVGDAEGVEEGVALCDELCDGDCEFDGDTDGDTDCDAVTEAVGLSDRDCELDCDGDCDPDRLCVWLGDCVRVTDGVIEPLLVALKLGVSVGEDVPVLVGEHTFLYPLSWIPDQVVSATKADPLFDTRAAAATPLARVGTPPLLTLNQLTATDADHVIMKYCELMVLAKKLYGKLMKII